MAERMFMKADEVAEVLEVSKPYVYKLIRQMNEKLSAKGCTVIAGRVERSYFYEHFYGSKADRRKEEANAGI